MKKLPKIYPVILSGGLGKRLWPISRETYPKQLIPLISEHSLFQKTTQRIKDPLRYFPATIVCNAEQRFVIAEQLNELNVSPNTIILEPTSRNTAPATALACTLLSEKKLLEPNITQRWRRVIMTILEFSPEEQARIHQG